jgi:UDP-GlcNAc:undecaprenyl-phosphate GlcNAc-1-phosphate transferase
MRHPLSGAIIWVLVLAVAVAGAVTLIAAPWVIRLARRAGAIAKPGGRRAHREPTPLWGGLAIMVGLFAAWAVALPIGSRLGLISDLRGKQLLGIGLGAVLVAALGAADDRFELRASAKLLGQIVCAAVLLPFGLRIEGLLAYPLPGWAGAALTVFWVVAIVNAVNLIDGLDGLAAGVTAIASAALAVISAQRAQPGAALLAATVAGGCLGFLPHNFSPARVFMGDLGSHFLGYMVAAIAVAGTLKRAAVVTIAGAVLALAFPLLDTAFAVLRRSLRGQGIAVGDNEHLHHRLVNSGLSDRQAVLLIWLLSALLGVAGVFVSQRGGG